MKERTMIIQNINKELSSRERKAIYTVIKECTFHCDDIQIIFYLPKEKSLPDARHTYHFSAEMEFLVVTKELKSAEKLWEKIRYPKSTTASYLLGEETICNIIIIADQEIHSEFAGMEVFFEKLMSSAIVWERCE